MATNNTNDYSKRTAGQVNAILKSNGITLKAENSGDGRLFILNANDIKTRFNVKKSGFILGRGDVHDKIMYFKAF